MKLARIALAVAASFCGLAALAPAALRAQDIELYDEDQCVADNPSCSGSPTCAHAASCPGKPGDPLLGGSLAPYLTAANVGPCDYTRFPGNGCADPRATCTKPSTPAAGVCAIQLQGLLYKPRRASGQHPAAILVPGSASCTVPLPGGGCTYPVEKFCELKNDLLAKGFVVFEVSPRGYEFSTGQYVSDNVTQQIVRDDACAHDHPGFQGVACAVLDLEDEGTQDVGAAFKWLRGQSFVDPKKVAVIGHSFGGIRSLAFDQFTYTDATHTQKPAAVVTIGASSESWCAYQPMLPELLHDVDIAKAPLYMLDTFNDVSRGPVYTLGAEIGATGHQYQTAIFPPSRDASGNLFTCGNYAHVCFVSDPTYVDTWASSVLDFLSRYGVR